MDHPMPFGRRTIVLPTIDHGDVTIPEPAWCVGHTDHRPGYRCDILHRGPDVALTFRGHWIGDATLVQSPFAQTSNPELGGPTPGVSVSLIDRTLNPVGVYELATAIEEYAGRLRSLAYELAVILAGGER